MIPTTHIPHQFRRAIVVLAAFCSCLLFSIISTAQSPKWPEEALVLFKTLPVQENGRVKPLDTVARFTLLRLNGKRTLSITSGSEGHSTTLSATEWMLDCLFFPETAKTYPCFCVESHEVITAIGLTPHSKKRDRYSYNQLVSGLPKLMSLAQDASGRPESMRSLVDGHLISLANNILLFDELINFLTFARSSFKSQDNPLLSEIFPDTPEIRMSMIVERVPEYLHNLVSQSSTMDDATHKRLAAGVDSLFTKLNEVADSAHLFALFPPLLAKSNEWLSPAGLMESAFNGQTPVTSQATTMKCFETLVSNVPDSDVFLSTLRQFHASIVTAANHRGEYRNIPLEVHYYNARYLFFSQWLFVLSFFIVALSWTRPSSGIVSRISRFSILPSIILLAIGITMRCIIRGRPPVTTLYETILFTTLVASSLGFILEHILKNRISISVATLFGTFGLFFAWRYEARESVDTMPAVIAVLDTNFWLATHVTTIIAGYGAGLFASSLAHIYLISQIPLLKKKFFPQPNRDLWNSVYGVMAFCLVFTLIGTVLGGIWAAQSWGRFWGWDPKENGALMIVLWTLAVMHAKRGHYVGPTGICVSAVILGMIVVFAWWGVNALGVGLHSYGFTTGIWKTLGIFWTAEAAFILIAYLAITFYPKSLLDDSPERVS